MNLEKAQFNMVEQQIRPWEVLDQRVLDILGSVPRSFFVPKEYESLAYADTMIPLEHDQCMLKPTIEGRLLQALNLQETDHVLEIGTGSGYFTTLLANLAQRVQSVDIFPDFVEAAEKRVKQQGQNNVSFAVADVNNNWQAQGQFDAIVVTGSCPLNGDLFKPYLRQGGSLVLVEGSGTIMEAVLIKATAPEQYSRESLFETQIPPLLNCQTASAFVF